MLTTGGETVLIVWVGSRHLDCSRHQVLERVWPIRIQAHAFGPNLPNCDLLVSPRHAIYCQDVLISARLRVNGRTGTQVDVDSVV